MPAATKQIEHGTLQTPPPQQHPVHPSKLPLRDNGWQRTVLNLQQLCIIWIEPQLVYFHPDESLFFFYRSGIT